MNKFMRMMVFFDLPVKTKLERKVATKFRKFLIDDGYHMLQYSLYVRTCNGSDAVEKHKRRLYASLPDNGSVRMLIITEKQFQNIEILVGKLTICDKPFETEQLTLF
jgi:CRISPR-associated protein Cas2